MSPLNTKALWTWASRALLAVSALFFGALFTTSFALLAEGAEEVGLPQGMAFGLMNVAWATGAVAGPAAGGAIAGATGDWIPFVIAAALCTCALVALPRRDVRYGYGVLPGDDSSTVT